MHYSLSLSIWRSDEKYVLCKLFIVNLSIFPSGSGFGIMILQSNQYPKEERSVNIIAEAKAAPRKINSTDDLLQKQLDMLKTMYEHRAISEAEFMRSSVVLKEKLNTLS